MLTIEELTAALNDPASPMREKLLKHLEMSPLDPAQAYQQVMQESGVQQGGMPPPQLPQGGEAPGSLAGILGGSMPPPPSTDAFMPPQPSPDLSREANPAGVVNLGDSSQVMPNILPGEPGVTGQAGGINFGALAKMLEGAGGDGQGDGYRPPPPPGAVAPRGNNWNTFSAAQLQTPQVARMPTLAELLNGRGR